MKRYLINNIDYQVDNDFELSDLPKTIEVSVSLDVANNEDELIDFLSNHISTETGFCNESFSFDEI